MRILSQNRFFFFVIKKLITVNILLFYQSLILPFSIYDNIFKKFKLFLSYLREMFDF